MPKVVFGVVDPNDDTKFKAAVKELANDGSILYYFRVRSLSTLGTPASEWSTETNDVAAGAFMPVPPYAAGHQADHTLAYQFHLRIPPGTPTTWPGITIPNPITVVTNAMIAGATRWQNKINGHAGLQKVSPSLKICQTANCSSSNSDGAVVKVLLKGNYDDDYNDKCGGAIACYEFGSDHLKYPLASAEIIFEEPAWQGGIRTVWTDLIPPAENRRITMIDTAEWRYAGFEATHELGHGLGMLDYVSGGMMDNPRHNPANPVVTDANIAHLEKMYRGHNPGDWQ